MTEKYLEYFTPLQNVSLCINVEPEKNIISGFIYFSTMKIQQSPKLRFIIPKNIQIVKITEFSENKDYILDYENSPDCDYITTKNVGSLKIFFKSDLESFKSKSSLPRLAIDQKIEYFDININIDKNYTPIFSSRYVKQQEFQIEESSLSRYQYRSVIPEIIPNFKFFTIKNDEWNLANRNFSYLVTEVGIDDRVDEISSFHANLQKIFSDDFLPNVTFFIKKDFPKSYAEPGIVKLNPSIKKGKLIELILESILINNIDFYHGCSWLAKSLPLFLKLLLLKSKLGDYSYDLKHVILLDRLAKEENIESLEKYDGSKEENMTKIKGYCFLRFLNEIVNDETSFLIFLRHFFSTYRNSSLTSTKQFIEFFINYFMNDKNPGSLVIDPKKVRWSVWMNSTGLPPDFEMKTSKKFQEFIESVVSGEKITTEEKYENRVKNIVENN